MSSILDALSKVDRADPRRGERIHLPLPAPTGRRPFPWGRLVGLGVAFAIGVGGTWWLTGRDVPVPEPDVVAFAPAVVQPPPPKAALVPPTTMAAAAAPAPPIPEAPAQPVAAAAPATVTAPPAQPAAPADAQRPFAEPDPIPIMPQPAAPPARAREGTPREAPGVRLSFLAYSRDPARRTVSLVLDDGTFITLHEGDHSQDIEVARIMPDHVQVRWHGELFTVRPR